MKKSKLMLAALVGVLALASSARAFDAASAPPEKRTKANLYLASPEVTASIRKR